MQMTLRQLASYKYPAIQHHSIVSPSSPSTTSCDAHEIATHSFDYLEASIQSSSSTYLYDVQTNPRNKAISTYDNTSI